MQIPALERSATALKAVTLTLCIGLASAAVQAATGSADDVTAAGTGGSASPGDALLSGTARASHRLVDQIDQRLKASTDREERLRLARSYNAAYFATEDPRLRQRISATLTQLIPSETDPAVGRALALSHSRLLFDGDTRANLALAYQKKFLSFDDYHGELAHAFPGAPPDIRAAMVQELAKGHNRYACDIVADYVGQGGAVALTAAEREALKGLLTTNEPLFSGAPASFGLFEAVRIEKWLGAMSAFGGAVPVAHANDRVIFDKLQQDSTDPRFAIAFLISARGRELAAGTSFAAEMSRARAKAFDFIDRHPGSPSLQSVRALLVDIRN